MEIPHVCMSPHYHHFELNILVRVSFDQKFFIQWKIKSGKANDEALNA